MIDVDGPDDPAEACSSETLTVRFDGFLTDMTTRIYTAIPKNALGPAARTSATVIKVQYATSCKSGIPISYQTSNSCTATPGPRAADGPCRVCAGNVFRQAAADLSNKTDFVRLRPHLLFSPTLVFDEARMAYNLKKHTVSVEDLFTGPALALLRAIQPAIQQGNPRLLMRLDKDGKLDLPVNPSQILRTPIPKHGKPEDYPDQISLVPAFSSHAPIQFFDAEACRLDHFGLTCTAELLREDVVSAIASALEQFDVKGAFQNSVLRGRARPNALLDLMEDKARFLLGAASTGERESCWDPLIGWMSLYAKNLDEIVHETAHVVYIPADRDRLPVGIGQAQSHDEAIRLIASELTGVRLIRANDDDEASVPDPRAMACLARLVAAIFGENRLDRASVVLDRSTVARRLIFDKKKAILDFSKLDEGAKKSLQALVGRVP